MNWIYKTLLVAGYVLAASSSAPPAPSADACNECKASDQNDRVKALIAGPYQEAWEAYHSVYKTENYTVTRPLMFAWKDSVAQIVDLIKNDGCLDYATFPTLGTLVRSILEMVGVDDNTEDLNLSNQAKQVLVAVTQNADQIALLMRPAYLAQPTCYPCQGIPGVAEDVLKFNCYLHQVPFIPMKELGFCEPKDFECPVIASAVSQSSSTAVVSSAAVSSAAVSSAAVSSAAVSSPAVSSPAVSSPAISSAAVSSAAVSSAAVSSAAVSSAAVSSAAVSSAAVSSPAVSSPAVSSAAVSSPAGSSPAGSSPAVSSQGESSEVESSETLSSQADVSSKVAVVSNTTAFSILASSSILSMAASLSAVASDNITSAPGSIFPLGSGILASKSSPMDRSNGSSSGSLSTSNENAVTTTVTTVLTGFTTYCPESTTFCVGEGRCYTATEATTITVTDCPCTLTTTCVPGKQTASVQSNHATATMPLLTVGPQNTGPVVAPESQASPAAPVAPVSQVSSVAPANAGSAALPQSLAAIFGAILILSIY